MVQVTVSDMNTGLYEATHHVLDSYDHIVSPRGMGTFEIESFHLELKDPHRPLANAINRLSYLPAIGVAEGLQLVAEESRPELLCKIAPAFSQFIEPKFATPLHGAYGPRVRGRVRKVIKELAEDPNSRQGVITVWDNYSDLAPWRRGSGPKPKDIPCTIGLHFMLRRGMLNLHVHMRSNDVWLGLPYDVMQFTILQCSVANALHVEAGRYFHNADSLHMYERDVVKARALTKFDHRRSQLWPMTGVGTKDMSWEEIQHRARTLLDGGSPRDMTQTEGFFHRALETYA